MCLNLLENTKAFTDGSKNHETSRAWWHTWWIHTTALGLYALESSPTHGVKPCLKKIPGRGEKKPSIHPRLSRGSLTLTNKKGREAEGPRTQEEDTEEQTANHTAPQQVPRAGRPRHPPRPLPVVSEQLQSSRAPEQLWRPFISDMWPPELVQNYCCNRWSQTSGLHDLICSYKFNCGESTDSIKF